MLRSTVGATIDTWPPAVNWTAGSLADAALQLSARVVGPTMSYLLTYGSGSNEAWMISNAGARWLFPLILQHPAVDPDVAHCLEMSWYVHGLTLSDVRSRDPDLARRIQAHLRAVCAEILQGKHGLMIAGLRERIVELDEGLGTL